MGFGERQRRLLQYVEVDIVSVSLVTSVTLYFSGGLQSHLLVETIYVTRNLTMPSRRARCYSAGG